MNRSKHLSARTGIDSNAIHPLIEQAVRGGIKSKETDTMKYFPMTPKAKALTGSRKKQFRLSDGETVNVNSYWDGGSRSNYAVLNIDTGLNIMPEGNHPFGAHGRLGYKLITGDLVIETGTFCGKPATPCFTCRAVDMDRVMAFLGLPSDPTDSTDDTNCEKTGNSMNLA